MRFARFTWNAMAALLNWYSPVENALIAKETAVVGLLKRNKWLPAVRGAEQTIREFLTLQARSDVAEAEYGVVDLQLDSIIKKFTTFVEAAERTPSFQNHQPGALVGEIRSHLDARKQARANPLNIRHAMVIHYPADLRNHKAMNFHALLARGQKVLWTLDVENCLSIGDPAGNKHSVVAVGMKVLGAGTAQLLCDDRTDNYYAMKDSLAVAEDLERRAKTESNQKERGVLVANAEHRRGMAAELSEALNGWVPSVNASNRTIVLDFDSGHYAPREAWKESTDAWNKAGYQVQWSASSKFT
jgi:hypothetical protein